MIYTDGYSIEQYPLQNRIVMTLPQTIYTVQDTQTMLRNRRVELTSNELTAILVAVKGMYEWEGEDKECFRAQLQRDLEKRRPEFIGVPLTCSHLGGTVECKLANASNKVWMGEWIPVNKELPKNDDWVIVTILDESGDTPFRYTDFGWYLEEANCWIVGAEKWTGVMAWMPLPTPWRGEEDEH